MRGGRRSTTFTPGHGGPGRPKKTEAEKAIAKANEADRKAMIADIKAAAKELTGEALATLQSALTAQNAPWAAKVASAQAILDRGWGRAPQAVTVGGDPDAPPIRHVKRIEVVVIDAKTSE